MFVGDFSKYSGFSVLDRQNLDRVINENYSGYYKEDHPDLDKLGSLLPTTYIMTGSITKTGSAYALQMQITDNQSGMTKASYSGTCSIAEFDNFTGIRRASLDLLTQMGVALKDRAKQELAAAEDAPSSNAQAALAQGIAAQRSGTVVEALSYFVQAAGYDPGLEEAASRLKIVSADISSGNIGQDARNDIQWRRDWINRLSESEEFFVNYTKTRDNAPYVIYYTTLEQGTINYDKETLSLSTKIILTQSDQWFKTLERVVETVRQGLEKTNRAKAWGLDWPNSPVSGQKMLDDVDDR